MTEPDDDCDPDPDPVIVYVDRSPAALAPLVLVCAYPWCDSAVTAGDWCDLHRDWLGDH